jgi:2-oxoisovalerate dehydrogenase E2 component (dihydrolipoyl transacylase)
VGVHVVRLPDVGEGVAEAELVEWHVSVGDAVTTESVLAEVMTDKATVEISSPVDGVVSALYGEPGEVLAIGSDFVSIDVGGAAPPPAADTTPDAIATPTAEPPTRPAAADGGAPTSASASTPAPSAAGAGAAGTSSLATSGAASRDAPSQRQKSSATKVADAPRAAPTAGVRPRAAPAVRQRARELGIDLRVVQPSGPDGRVVHADLDAFLSGGPRRAAGVGAADDATTTTPLIGLRKRIAERLTTAASEIPHITYVDEVDVTELERLRAKLNERRGDDVAKLTLLPFVARAIVAALGEQPHLNATYDPAAGLTTHTAVHIGVATQTPDGLVVPVVRQVQSLDVWEIATEISRLAEAARTGKATRDELRGSTITITSLGALGGLVTTPIINHPEVAIVGVNKMQVRPMWDGSTFVPRTMVNLSCSFDHRIVDGWDAATFVQRLKELLETPALLFVDAPGRR